MWIPRSVRSRKNTENRPSSGTKWPKNRERREKFKQKWGRHRRSIFNTIITLPFRNIQKAFKSHPRKDLLSPLFICLLLIHVIWVRVEVHTQCHSAPLLSTQKKIRRTVVMLYLLQMRAHLLTRLRGWEVISSGEKNEKKSEMNEWMKAPQVVSSIRWSIKHPIQPSNTKWERMSSCSSLRQMTCHKLSIKMVCSSKWFLLI